MRTKEPKYTKEDLKQMQAFPLERKIAIAQTRIFEWILKNGEDHVAVSFSGGKDSTVLLDLVRRINPNVIAIFSDTGLEFPEIREFALSHDKVVTVRPKNNFLWVLRHCGYPLISKETATKIEAARNNTEKKSQISIRKLLGTDTYTRDGVERESWYNIDKYLPLSQLPIPISVKCCGFIKEAPLTKYHKENKILPIIGTMASESRRREKGWLTNGCNAFDISSHRRAVCRLRFGRSRISSTTSGASIFRSVQCMAISCRQLTLASSQRTECV